MSNASMVAIVLGLTLLGCRSPGPEERAGDPDDQTLLILRIDRALPWIDIARVMTDEPDEPDLSRHAAALRKRFERLKQRIRDQRASARPTMR